MFFIRKKNVDEDVEKIRQYTLSPEQLAAEIKEKEEAKEAEKKHAKEQLEDFTAKDVLAMSIAAFQVLLPYVLLVFGSAAVIFLLFYYLGTH